MSAGHVVVTAVCCVIKVTLNDDNVSN